MFIRIYFLTLECNISAFVVSANCSVTIKDTTNIRFPTFTGICDAGTLAPTCDNIFCGDEIQEFFRFHQTGCYIPSIIFRTN